MKKRFITLTILIVATLFTSQAYAADVAKIGVLHFEKILNDSSAGKLTQKKLKDKWTELQKKIDSEKKAIQDMDMALKRESLVLSKEKKRDRGREIEDRIDDFKKMNTDYTEEFRIMQNERINQIQKDVFEIANAIGKKEGFLLILERKTAGVIYMPDQVDITDRIVKAYNVKFSEKK